MTITTDTARRASSYDLPGRVAAGGLDIYVKQVGHGPDVLLIGGLGDAVESWQFQLEGLADRYRLTAFDTAGRGARRCPTRRARSRLWPRTPPASCARSTCRAPTSPASRWEARSPRSWRFATRGWSAAWCSWAPTLARTPFFRSQLEFWRWLAETAPSERAFFEAFFTLGLHAARARGRHRRPDCRRGAGLPPSAIRGGLPGTARRLPRAPHGRPPVADRRAYARSRRGARHPSCRPASATPSPERSRTHASRSCPEEAHQPFQEVPDQFNARVDAFWRALDGRA